MFSHNVKYDAIKIRQEPKNVMFLQLIHAKFCSTSVERPFAVQAEKMPNTSFLYIKKYLILLCTEHFLGIKIKESLCHPHCYTSAGSMQNSLLFV